MKNGLNLGKFCPELEQKLTIFSKNFLDASLSVLTKFHLRPKDFGSREYCSYL
jgi:hypothetical protein